MIYVIIPAYNRIQYTLKCIESILLQQVSCDLRLIVIDDGSTDGTPQILKETFGEKVLVLNGTGNLYWTGAVALGIAYALSLCSIDDFLLLVNNDVILEANVINELMSHCISTKYNSIVGAIGINCSTNRVVKSGTVVKNWFLNITNHVYHGKDRFNIKNFPALDVDFITARCLLHPIKVFLCAGNYDAKNFLHYGADDEFAMRIKHFGFSSIVCPSALITIQDALSVPRINCRPDLFYTLFSIRSSSNVINKLKLSWRVAPFYAKASFFLIGVLKSFAVFLRDYFLCCNF